MALLGSGIDPNLMINDYSGFARAGEIQGQMYAQMGKDIAGGIESGIKLNQQNKQMQGQVDSATKGYEYFAKAFPDQAEFFNSQAQDMMNPNLSLADKIGRLSSGQQLFGDFLNMQQLRQRQQQIDIQRANAGQNTNNQYGVN
jgi:hypothetical protein